MKLILNEAVFPDPSDIQRDYSKFLQTLEIPFSEIFIGGESCLKLEEFTRHFEEPTAASVLSILKRVFHMNVSVENITSHYISFEVTE